MDKHLKFMVAQTEKYAFEMIKGLKYNKKYIENGDTPIDTATDTPADTPRDIHKVNSIDSIKKEIVNKKDENKDNNKLRRSKRKKSIASDDDYNDKSIYYLF